MARKSVITVLASVGVMYSGAVTPDLVAFAGAIQKQDRVALIDFVTKHPQSAFVPDAIILAGVVDEQCRQDPTRRDLILKYRDCLDGSNKGADRTKDAPVPFEGQPSRRPGTGGGPGFEGGSSV